MINLKDKVALVTGASGEKGRAICKALARNGVKVVVHYFRNKKSAKTLVENILGDSEGASFCFQADITSHDDVKKMFQEVLSKYGALDILVNNAHAKISRNPFVKTSWEDHQGQIDVLTKGSFFCIQEALKVMLKKKQGSIINILSTQTNMPVKGYSSFTTALSSMAGLSKNLAMEVGNKGIRVNMIAPGFTATDRSEHAPLSTREKIIEQTPLKRLATPDDIANAVLFLASNLSSFVTGGYLVVDGGIVTL